MEPDLEKTPMYIFWHILEISSASGVETIQVCVQTNDVTAGDLILILGLCLFPLMQVAFVY